MVVEIPRWTNAKIEIDVASHMNPLKQDTKKGQLRFVRNCFPHHGYIWNYGALPQTWEDPTSVHAETKARGDKDPLDVCEIGQMVGYSGQVKRVKVLGAMALLDEGETDWKIIAIDVDDPLAPKLRDIEDVEKHLPGLLRATNEWFRIYKIPDGKGENGFAFSGEAKNAKFASEVIRECHESWQRLIQNQLPPGGEKYEIATANATVNGSPYRTSPDDEKTQQIPQQSILPAEPMDPLIDKWFFISGSPNL